MPTIQIVVNSIDSAYIGQSSKYNWRAQWKIGITVFDNLKRSKVNKEFLLPCKTTRLNFNSTQFQLLNFSLESLFEDENALLTFDLLEVIENGYPPFPLSPSIIYTPRI